MKDDYRNLFEGHITVNEKPVVSGRIQWLAQGGKYKGMKFHTEPLTAEQAHLIDEGPIELGFLDANGNGVGIGEGTIRADTPVREGAETTVLMATNEHGWDLHF